MTKPIFAVVPVSLALLLAACGGEEADAPAAPVGDEPAAIDERQDNFEAISDAFKAIREQMDSGSPDLAAVQEAAADINTRAGLIGNYFPEGSGYDAGWDTEALPAIWEKPEEFAAAQQKLVDESAKLAELAAAGDAAAVGKQVGAMGGACKNCHDSFRLDTD